MRLGFPGRIYGLANGATSEKESDLGHWLLYLSDAVRYLSARHVRLYRIILPNMPSSIEYERQLCEQMASIALLAQDIADADIRLTAHMPLSLILSTPDEAMACAAIDWLTWASHLLTLLSPQDDSILIAHFGGIYDDRTAAIARFCARYETFPPRARRLFCLENDDHGLSFVELMAVQQRIGVPVVLDNLHLAVNNPEGIPLSVALEQALGTWSETSPKVHYCDPRTEARGLGRGRVKLPTWTEHSDFVNPFAFVDFVRQLIDTAPADIMLEAKARDLAWLKLRDDLRHYAPDTYAVFDPEIA